MISSFLHALAVAFLFFSSLLFAEHNPISRPRVTGTIDYDLDEGMHAGKDYILQTQQLDAAVGMFFMGEMYKTFQKKFKTDKPFVGLEESFAKRIEAVVYTASAHQKDRPFDWKILLSSAAMSRKDPKQALAALGLELALSNQETAFKYGMTKSNNAFKGYFSREIEDVSTDPTTFIYAEAYRSFLEMVKNDPSALDVIRKLPEEMQRPFFDVAYGRYISDSPAVQSLRNKKSFDAANEKFGSLSAEHGRLRHSDQKKLSQMRHGLQQAGGSLEAMREKAADGVSLDEAVRRIHEGLQQHWSEQDTEARKKKIEDREQAELDAKFYEAMGNAAHATIQVLAEATKDDPKAQQALTILDASAQLATMSAMESVLADEALTPTQYLNMYATGVSVGLKLLNATQNRQGTGLKALMKSIQRLREMLIKMDRKISGISNEQFNQAGTTRREFENLRSYMNMQFDRLERRLNSATLHLSDRFQKLEEGNIAMQRQYFMDRKHDADIKAEELRNEAELSLRTIQAFPAKDAEKKGYHDRDYQVAMDKLWQAAVRQSQGPSLVGPRDSTLAIQEFADSLSKRQNPDHFMGLLAKALVHHDIDISLPLDRSDAGRQSHDAKVLSLNDWTHFADMFNQGISPLHAERFNSYIKEAKGMTNLKEVLDLGVSQHEMIQKLLPRDSTGRPMGVKLVPLVAAYDRELKNLTDVKALIERRNQFEKTRNYDPKVPADKQTLASNADPRALIPLHKPMPPCPSYSKRDGQGNSVALPELRLSPEKIESYRRLIPEIALVAADISRGEAGKIGMCYRDLNSRIIDKTSGRRRSAMTVDFFFEDIDGNRLPFFSREVARETNEKLNAPQLWAASKGAMEVDLLKEGEKHNEIKSELLETTKSVLANYVTGILSDATSSSEAQIAKDTALETGDIGKALRRIESAKQILGWALWLAYGDEALTNPELALKFRSLPGRTELKLFPELQAKGLENARSLLNLLADGGTYDKQGTFTKFTPGHAALDDTISELTEKYQGKWNVYSKMYEAPGSEQEPNKLKNDPFLPEISPPNLRLKEQKKISELLAGTPKGPYTQGPPPREINVGNSTVIPLSETERRVAEATDSVVREMLIRYPQIDLQELEAIRSAFDMHKRAELNPKFLDAKRMFLDVKVGEGPRSIVVNGENSHQAGWMKQLYDFLHSDSNGPKLPHGQVRHYLEATSQINAVARNEVEIFPQYWKTLSERNTEAQRAQKFRELIDSLIKAETSTHDRAVAISKRIEAEKHDDTQRTELKSTIQTLISKGKRWQKEADEYFVEIRQSQIDLNTVFQILENHQFVHKTSQDRKNKSKYTETITWERTKEKVDYPENGRHPQAYFRSQEANLLFSRLAAEHKRAVKNAKDGDDKFYIPANTLKKDDTADAAARALDSVNFPNDLPGLMALKATIQGYADSVEARRDKLKSLRHAQDKWIKELRKDKEDESRLLGLVSEWDGARVNYTKVERKGFSDDRTDVEISKGRNKYTMLPLIDKRK